MYENSVGSQAASRRPPTAVRLLLATLSVLVLVVLAAIPAGAMTITFIRHAESAGNASGYIDTSVPGPELTEKGWDEADALPAKLAGSGIDAKAFDRFYASTMIRTQQTAQPLLESLNRSGDELVVIGTYDPARPRSVAGIQEIGAGIFEGSSQEDGLGRLGYGLAPIAWALGARFVRIPGSEDGNEFAARMAEAIAQMEADGDADGDGEINVVAFSHGATMMFWTMMTVDNPNLLLMLQHPLDNTNVVVVEKNDDGSYTLKSWAGQEVAAATYPVKMLVNVRDLVVAPQTALHNLRQPVFDADVEAVGQTAVRGVRDVGDATVKFVTDSVTDTVDAIRDLVRPRAAQVEQQRAEQPQSTASSGAEPAATELEADPTADDAPVASSRELVRQLAAAGTDRAGQGATYSESRTAVRDLGRSTRSELAEARGEMRDRVRSAVGEAADHVRKAADSTRESVRKAVSGKDKTSSKTDSSDSSSDKDAA
ncbi:histidine phosphatase family protein [[Mycobacterium] wendilense]|uniref:Histidine phosphatase family protein n=1 Tax=[Mycobacterium] wendilense TaxID=3064284 RepID=A0ABM9M8X0_9MYCO|nr:histidine phosphatase family protein [Mycolicibacterium sp. MU0050]CAJ1579301.1 histidine phosphatase family protein [Mycolicibacterium sp. MU0050]